MAAGTPRRWWLELFGGEVVALEERGVVTDAGVDHTVAPALPKPGPTAQVGLVPPFDQLIGGYVGVLLDLPLVEAADAMRPCRPTLVDGKVTATQVVTEPGD